MDPMLIGQLLIKKASSENTLYSPWISAKGDCGVFAVVLIEGGSSDYHYVIETRPLGGTDAGSTPIGSPVTIGSTAGPRETQAAGAQDLVRYVIYTDNNGNAGWMHFQLVEPRWCKN